MKILLVEDERMTRVALTGTLRKVGHEVVPCPDGRVAMSALDSDRFDIVLTDLNLPGPDGMEILTRSRRDDPEAQVIIMTAYASTETAVEALRQGAYDYVIKPFQTGYRNQVEHGLNHGRMIISDAFRFMFNIQRLKTGRVLCRNTGWAMVCITASRLNAAERKHHPPGRVYGVCSKGHQPDHVES